MGKPKVADLTIRISIVGHASPRWRSAATKDEADQLNQTLSEQRAKNVRAFVEHILKEKIPDTEIGITSRGAGSHERLPGPYGDNWAIDRSIVLMIQLTTTHTLTDTVMGPPRKLPAPTDSWSATVLDLQVYGFLYGHGLITLSLRNNLTGKEIKARAKIYGEAFGAGGKSGLPKPVLPGKSLPHPLGTVVFTTKNVMGFGGFRDAFIRVGKLKTHFIVVGNQLNYFTFPDLGTDPDMLIFDTKPFKLGLDWPKFEEYIMSGWLDLIGDNPGDTLDVPGLPISVPYKTLAEHNQGVIITFPTEKSSIDDLKRDEGKKLRDYVISAAQQIRAGVEAVSG